MSAWSTSRLTFRRQLFQVFKRLSLLAFLGDTEDDGTNPVWPEIGYPGPVSAPPATPKPIRTTTLDGHTTLNCHAVVIGSGARGGADRTDRGRLPRRRHGRQLHDELSQPRLAARGMGESLRAHRLCDR